MQTFGQSTIYCGSDDTAPTKPRTGLFLEPAVFSSLFPVSALGFSLPVRHGGDCRGPSLASSKGRGYVRFGSLADILTSPRHVRFTPNNGRWAAPAFAAGGSTVVKLAITTANSLQAGAGNCTGTSASCSLTAVQVVQGSAKSATIQCNFVYGSGGTSADLWVQTSVDGGTTWTDIAECGFTTSSVRKLYNLSGLTPVTTVYPATDGTLAANTAKDGILGTWYRAKWTTVGTYAGTTLTVDVVAGRSRTQP